MYEVLDDQFGPTRHGYKLEIVVKVDMTTKIRLLVDRDFYDFQCKYQSHVWSDGKRWELCHSLQPESITMPSPLAVSSPHGNSAFDAEMVARHVVEKLLWVSLRILNKKADEEIVRAVCFEHSTPLP
jgi:hypothetical protein